MSRALTLLLLVTTLGCVHPAPPAAPLADGTLPRPFTPAQLAAAFPDGTLLRLRLTRAGEAPVVQEWRFDGGDAAGTDIHSRMLTPAGAVIADEGEARSTWLELVDHAAFPAADTTVEAGRVTVPAGTFRTRLYVVHATDPAGGAVVRRYHFAPSLPGPPVLMTVEAGGAEVLRMELLERSPRP